jgi:hypothetical protein
LKTNPSPIEPFAVANEFGIQSEGNASIWIEWLDALATANGAVGEWSFRIVNFVADASWHPIRQ